MHADAAFLPEKQRIAEVSKLRQMSCSCQMKYLPITATTRSPLYSMLLHLYCNATLMVHLEWVQTKKRLLCPTKSDLS
ncbi:hypothetical protein CIPAW_02G097600 [Carya illinoinensis]|uniref:Uncharacterized protein n=1 Tax=Carya illinoinensis TaxID=32201 RepID=A0A8T1RC37_CARIL|nr:hypothetical protein CIPAW_02G097600 [Carya illinoinensis]